MSAIEEYRQLLKDVQGSMSAEGFTDAAINKILDFISKHPDASAVALKREIETAWGSNYRGYVKEAFSKYADLLAGVNKIYADLGVDVTRDMAKVQSIEKVYQVRYGKYSEASVRELQRRVRQGLAKDLTEKELTEELQKAGGKIATYADTISNTQFGAYGQNLKNIKADLGDVDKFEYVGPLHVHSRAFCLKHIGRIYSKAEIKQLDNDPDLGGAGIRPVALYKGGWNCYHDWEPVV